LVIWEDKQVEGFDFIETFALVAKLTSVRCFLAITTARGWELHQMDVNNAFLHGDLEEEVCMTPPLGFRTSTTNKFASFTNVYIV